MGRELRKVPANWEHPKDDNGNWQPMLNEYYGDALSRWLENHKQWEQGTHPELLKDPKLKEEFPFWAMYDVDAPEIQYYQTRKFQPEELTHIQLYEETTEGTPLSPVYPMDELLQLCEWAAENATTFADFKATKEQWLKMLSEDFVHHREGNIIFL